MRDFPFISIIILNFNGIPFLEKCFRSLENLNYPKDKYEVIMGDNASTDNSVEYTKNKFPWIKIICFDKNYGFCRSNNLCAKEAKGDYLLFLNNDTYVEREWLLNMVKGIISEKDVISCACKILFPDLEGGKLVNAAGGVIFPSGSGIYEGWLEVDSQKFNYKKYTAFGCAAGVLVQKKFFLDTGGFDEYYFYSGEEMDLGFRIWTHGFKVLYIPSAIMYHYMGKTGFRKKSRTPAVEFLVMRNKIYFILKNFEFLNIIKGLFLVLLAAIYEILYSLLHRNISIPISVIKAHIFILKDIKKIILNRKNFQKNRKISDKILNKAKIIIGFREWIKRSYSAAKNMEKYFGGVFDTKNAVKIKEDKDGNLIFYKDKK